MGEEVQGISPAAAAVLKEVGVIAEAHDGATVESVAIAWAMAKGVVALLGTRKAGHLSEALHALELRLTDDEIQRLDSVALEDEGMYASMLEGNAFKRFIAKNVLAPLLQDPLRARPSTL